MITPRRVMAYLGGGMGRGAMGLAVLTMVTSIVSYAGTLLLSRLLDPSGFGDLMALLALAIIIAIPAAAAQTVVASRVTFWRANGTPDDVARFIRHALAHMAVVATFATLLYAACIPLVIKAFSLQAPGPAIALTPLVGLSFFFAVIAGVLQGGERYVLLGILNLVVTFARYGLGVAWAAVGGGPGGAIGGQAVGIAIVSVAALVMMRPLIAGRGSGAAASGLRRVPDLRTMTASLGFLAIAVLSTLDLVLAKAFMSPADAGLYAALTVIGKAILFLPIALAQVVVPPAVKNQHSAEGRAGVLRRSAVPISLSCGIIGLPLIVAPSFWMGLLFGSAYSGAGPGVLPMVLASTALSLLFVVLTFTVAVADKVWSLLLLPGIVLQVVGIALFHGSPAQIAWVQAVVMLLLLLGNEMFFHPLVRRRRHVRMGSADLAAADGR